MSFYSPYQFIPSDQISKHLNNFKEITDGLTNIRHDRWQKGTFSGRVICKLTAKTPIMLGGPHEGQGDNQPTLVKNYRVPQDDNGKLAIPASSLRGMIASVAEAISLSSMRVLDDKHYSQRKKMSDSLKAIGQVERIDGQWKLRPLAIMSAKKTDKDHVNFDNKWISIFGDRILAHCFPGYLGKYSGEHLIHDNEDISHWNSFNPQVPEFIYIRFKSDMWQNKFTRELNRADHEGSLHIRKTDINNKEFFTFLGQKLYPETQVYTQEEFDDLDDEEKKAFLRGIFYALGKSGRIGKNELLPGKKEHELFLPYPDEIGSYELLDLKQEVVDQFNKLALERFKDTDKEKKEELRLPILPKGRKHPKQKNDKSKVSFVGAGDIVYFDIDESQAVTEISYSSIWRKALKNTTHEYFLRSGNYNILPWGAENRSGLTPVEAMFGVVSANSPRNKEESVESQNLASRIKFYDAFGSGEITLGNKETLKILASPKPPSPIMYFHHIESHQSIHDNDLNKESAIPNGRKRYLHHRQTEVKNRNWKTSPEKENDNLGQKVSCTPIESGSFHFHIDFDNLNQNELGLLLSALEPDHHSSNQEKKKESGSSLRFWHKIGLGKPYGLGSVDVKVLGVFLIDRKQRYSSIGLSNNSRYNESLILASEGELEGLHKFYAQEIQFTGQTQNFEEQIKQKWNTQYVDESALKILYRVGCKELMEEFPVTYPYLNNRQKPGEEGEGFKWFMQNREIKNMGSSSEDHIPFLSEEKNIK